MHKKIILALVTFIFSFVVLDLLLYKLFPKPCQFIREDQILEHKLIPGATCQVRTEEYNVQYRINSIGHRGTETIGNNSNGYFRILMLGDSFTFGTGVSLEDTMVKKLEKDLQEFFKSEKIEVINSGLGGYATSEQYLYLKNYGVNLNPDLVILNLSMNDFTEERANLNHAKYDDKENLMALRVDKKRPPSTLDKFLRNNSFSYYLFLRKEEDLMRLKGRIVSFILGREPPKYTKSSTDFTPGDKDRDLFVITRDIPSSDFEELFANVANRIIDIKKFLDQRNIPLLLTIIPSGHQVSVNEWRTGRQVMKLKDTSYPRKIFDKLQNFSQENQIQLLDLSPYLISYTNSNPSRKLYYDYDGHFTPFGQEVAGKAIFEFIIAGQKPHAFNCPLCVKIHSE